MLAVDDGSGCVEPNESTVRDGTYKPLSRPLYIYVRHSSLQRPEVVDFVNFYLANAGTLAIDVGYVPVSDEVASKNQAALSSVIQQ